MKLPTRMIVLSLTILLLGNCTKIKTTDIGSDLLPPIDRVQTFDTLLPVVTDNLLFPDSVLPLVGKDYSGRAVEHILGSINADPLFGKTTASVFMELKPAAYRFYYENVADSLYLDSVVLCLKWNRTWGDTMAPHTFDVFRVDQPIRRDTTYSTNANFPYSQLLGNTTFAPRILDDSVPLRKWKTIAQLRIRLSDAFGKELLKLDSADGKPFANDSLYRDYLKGFAIVPNTTGSGANANALMGFALSDTNTYLGIYYRYVKNGNADTTFKKFNFDNSLISGSANRIIRDRKGSEMEKYTAPSASGDSLVYIQVSPGSYAKVSIPSLAGFKAAKGNVLINLAELQIHELPASNGSSSPILPPPPFVYADFYDTTIKFQSPFGQDGFPGGTYDASLLGGIQKTATLSTGVQYATYGIYLTRHIQSIITRDKPNLPLHLFAPYFVSYPSFNVYFNLNPLATGRVRVGGGNHSSRPMRLRIVYTKL